MVLWLLALNLAALLVLMAARARGVAVALVLLNAAAALMVSGIAADLKDGIQLAAKAIDSGTAMRTLEAFKSYTQENSAK